MSTNRVFIYGLIVLGFVGLIGAHEISGTDENADVVAPFLLATAGTLSFVTAGVLAFRMLRGR
jgi:hypothetical protein